MKILGISGSPRRGRTTDRLVKEVLGAVECETEFISLAGKKIAPCRACMACLNDNTCKLQDDMMALRPKLLEADGLVIGAPNFFGNLSALIHCFLERFCQFRHRSEGRLMAGKEAVIVSTGTLKPEIPARLVEGFLPYYQINHVGTVQAQGAAACFTCGYGETCSVGVVKAMYGDVRLSPELIPDLDNQPQKVKAARLLGRELELRLLGKKISKQPTSNAGTNKKEDRQ